MRMQGTPLVVDGVMYVSNGWSVIYALDATTGEEIWKYDPEVDSYIRLACCGPAHNRGVAVYEGKVFVGTFDGRLIAVNAENGEEVWDVDTWIPEGLGRFNITGAPRAAAGKVYIGQGSGESGHRRGYVTAYDADTGEVSWRFFLVPGDPSQPFEHPEMELAAQTWGGEWWKYGGVVRPGTHSFMTKNSTVCTLELVTAHRGQGKSDRQAVEMTYFFQQSFQWMLRLAG